MATSIEKGLHMANRNAVTAVRDAIRRDPRSLSRIARDARVGQSQVSRFINGKRSVSLETASRLMGTLGLTVTPGRRTA
jgi:plasmid maintenance system antidote protein VapI